MNRIKTLFITGVSSGFGNALAREALAAGHRVIGTVRNEAALQAFQALSVDRAHGALRQGHSRDPQDPQLLPGTPGRGVPGPGSEHERAQLSPALSQRDERLSDAVPEIDALAPGATADAASASTAAFNVGYESASQFSREFKRFFGRTPQAEIEWMKATYALPAPSTPSAYVSSH